MRTTVTLDPDVEALLRRTMRKRGISFKAALNQAIRDGLAGPVPKRSRPLDWKAYRMGKPLVPLDHALSLAAALEDEEIIRKMNLGK
jgi:hypothetical protein